MANALLEFLDRKRKRYQLALENRYYRWRHGRPVDLRQYTLHADHYSGRRLNIVYLTHWAAPFQVNNTLRPLEEFGSVAVFELDPDRNRKTWYQRKQARNREMLEFVRARAAERRIDVIVCYLSGFSTDPATLQALRELGIPMVNESLDDERKFVSRRGKDGLRRGSKDICRYFDLCLTTSQSAIVKYLVEGARPMYKPYGANPAIYRRLEGVAKRHDVVFVGACYGVRPLYVAHLRNHGIEVQARGEGWPGGPVSDAEMVTLFNQAKIIIGFAGVGKNDDIFILKGRDFEAPLTGSFYLTQYHEELREYFRLGQDIETWRDREELLDKVRYYLRHDAARETIARAGQQRCLQNYTTSQSYRRVFGALGL